MNILLIGSGGREHAIAWKISQSPRMRKLYILAGNPGTGSFQGNTFVWTFSQDHIQVADPGYFNLDVSGGTSGTPVSRGRGFSRTGGQFGVYIKQIAIIQ